MDHFSWTGFSLLMFLCEKKTHMSQPSLSLEWCMASTAHDFGDFPHPYGQHHRRSGLGSRVMKPSESIIFSSCRDGWMDGLFSWWTAWRGSSETSTTWSTKIWGIVQKTHPNTYYIYVYTNNPHLKIKQPLCRNPMINSDKNKTHLQPGKLGNQQRWQPTIDFQQFLPDQKAIPKERIGEVSSGSIHHIDHCQKKTSWHNGDVVEFIFTWHHKLTWSCHPRLLFDTENQMFDAVEDTHGSW